MIDTPKRLSPVVRVSAEGNAFTTSADVAAHFDKRHGDVLRAIERLLLDLTEHAESYPETDLDIADGQGQPADHQRKIAFMIPAQFFEEAEVEVRLGKGGLRRDRSYNLSRDGFALLAMGFTGKQALTFKLAYIAAFNCMEEKPRQPYIAPLVGDLEFGKGIKMKDKIMLHEQAYKAPRALTQARNDDERWRAYWQLLQINSTLGIPMPTMDALGVSPLLP